MNGMTQQAAAAVTGMSERTARTWEQGPLPSGDKTERDWRTRPDPFAAVWERDIVPQLRADEQRKLEAKTLLAVLAERHPGQFPQSLLRTLQRRVRDWRALSGPAKEVYFPQQHLPGREAALDFTDAAVLGVTICGMVFPHLLFELVLCFSGWFFAQVAFSETREALSAGLQEALWAVGGVTQVVRSDNMSAATRELRHSRGRVPNEHVKALLLHYGLAHTRIQAGKSHENGVVEQKHFRFKGALEQALLVRGSRDFDSEPAYRAFVHQVQVQKRAELDVRKVEEERRHLRPLPARKLPDYTEFQVVVRKWSTISVSKKTYSVPARLIGETVEVRRHADVLEVRYKGHLVETMPRLRGTKEHRVDYRHVIQSLVRKPGAFARYRYREEMFPTLTFRRAYDELKQRRGERADVEYVRILALCLSSGQEAVERGLLAQLEAGGVDFGVLKQGLTPSTSTLPSVALPVPDLSRYDQLLTGGVA